MKIDDLISYHARRAMRELDMGLGAASRPAARAHLALSSLHLERLRVLRARSAQAARRAA